MAVAMTFRQKILSSYVGLFLLFVLLMLIVVQISVGTVVRRALRDRATELIEAVQSTDTIEDAIQMLKGHERTFFFRVGILDSQGRILYDSKARKLFGAAFDPTFQTNHPEVWEALADGEGYHEDYSALFSQKFAYLAQSFDFHGQTLVLRLAFPFKPIESLSQDFEFGFLLLMILVLLTFCFMTWLIINYLTRPVSNILKAIRPYQQGFVDRLPFIPIYRPGSPSEFDQLAHTFNQLSRRIEAQIHSLKRERNEKEALLLSMTEGVVAVDGSLKLIFINSAALRILGVRSPPLEHTTLESLESRRKEIHQQVLECLQAVLSSKETVHQTFQTETPKLEVLDLVGAPITGGDGALLVLQDVTTQYQVVRVGKEFVANASHELRTPITIIHGFAETLHEYQDLRREVIQEITEKILRSCQRMESLIQNLLLLADLENQCSAKNRTFAFDEVLETSLDHLTVMHPQIQVDCQIEGMPLWVYGQPDLMELMIMNLLGNAVKYSPDHPEISVGASRDGEGILFTITDHGIGIPEGDVEHIFERFYTVDKARSRRLGGAGLGLALVKTIVDQHRGKIEVKSIVGQGTTFKVWLPCCPEEHSRF